MSSLIHFKLCFHHQSSYDYQRNPSHPNYWCIHHHINYIEVLCFMSLLLLLYGSNTKNIISSRDSTDQRTLPRQYLKTGNHGRDRSRNHTQINRGRPTRQGASRLIFASCMASSIAFNSAGKSGCDFVECTSL